MAPKNIHFIGIGGISQSALAIILHKNGFCISGSDCQQNAITTKLQNMGIKIYIGHNKQNVEGANLVVYSAAIGQDNPEIIEAKKLNIVTVSRAQLLGTIAAAYNKVISISGTHGKTTATSMLAAIFLKAKKNPTLHIGGNLPQINGNVFVGGKNYFITEACEYCDSFLSLNNFYGVVLNLQEDHMDYFKNLANLQKSFQKFAKNTNDKGFLVVNADDNFCKRLITPATKMTYGINNNAHIMAKNIRARKGEKYSYNLFVCGKKIAKIKLPISGKHNIYNSLAAISVALCENIKVHKIKSALKHFKMPERRFQKIKNHGATIVHDYAHHPTEIAASINTAKQMAKGKLVVVFQPHTYSRTQYLFKQFLTCFKGADQLVLLPIYAARETPIENVSSNNLAIQIAKTGQSVQLATNLEHAYKLLQQYNKKGNFILILGAGSIEKLVEYFKKNK